MSKTLLLRLFNIRCPLIKAPMCPLTTTALVDNVSDEEGMGTIAVAKMTGEQLEHEISQIRSLTDKSFGVNIFTLPSRQFGISTQAIGLIRTEL